MKRGGRLEDPPQAEGLLTIGSYQETISQFSLSVWPLQNLTESYIPLSIWAALSGLDGTQVGWVRK